VHAENPKRHFRNRLPFDRWCPTRTAATRTQSAHRKTVSSLSKSSSFLRCSMRINRTSRMDYETERTSLCVAVFSRTRLLVPVLIFISWANCLKTSPVLRRQLLVLGNKRHVRLVRCRMQIDRISNDLSVAAQRLRASDVSEMIQRSLLRTQKSGAIS